MDLAPGFRLRLAPRFHVACDWARRLQINGGVEGGQGRAPAGSRRAQQSPLLPRQDWRGVQSAELDLLAADPDSGDAPLPREAAGLLLLPRHLRDAWWEAAAQTEAGGGAAYERFVGQLVDFFQFKQLPLPPSCAFDVRVSRPGLRSLAARAGTGLGGNGDGKRVVAWINLGDEATHLVFLNLAPPAMRAMLAEPAAEAALLRRFFTRLPAYPLLRLRLEPGEGLWFPLSPVAHDGDTQGKLDLDVVLTLTSQP